MKKYLLLAVFLLPSVSFAASNDVQAMIAKMQAAMDVHNSPAYIFESNDTTTLIKKLQLILGEQKNKIDQQAQVIDSMNIKLQQVVNAMPTPTPVPTPNYLIPTPDPNAKKPLCEQDEFGNHLNDNVCDQNNEFFIRHMAPHKKGTVGGCPEIRLSKDDPRYYICEGASA